jgi:hypothetical protein
MMFGRRKGEILFRPVEKIELVLVGDQPRPGSNPYFDWETGAPRDSGDKFKSMYMNNWAVEPHSKQREAIETDAPMVLYGSSGGGKSWRQRGLAEQFYRDSVLEPNAGPRTPMTRSMAI